MTRNTTADWTDGVFEAASSALLLVLPSGRVRRANPAALTLFGRLRSELEGAHLDELLELDGEPVLPLLQQQATHSGRAEVSCTGYRRDASSFDAVVRTTTIRARRRSAWLVDVRDVTELRRTVARQAALSRKILVAQEEERARISRDLHDGLGQIIAALHLEIAWLRSQPASTDASPGDRFAGAETLIDQAGELLRRLCRGLRPPLLDSLGLLPAIRQLLEAAEARASLTIELDEAMDEDRDPVPPDVALCAFRVLQEALNNVIRHASATGVIVGLTREYQWLVLSVYDNGVGFELAPDAASSGFGLEGMRERARLMGGELAIRSVPGQGTRITLRLPVPRPTQEDEP